MKCCRLTNIDVIIIDYYDDYRYTYDKILDYYWKMGKEVGWDGGDETRRDGELLLILLPLWRTLLCNAGFTVDVSKIRMKSGRLREIARMFGMECNNAN